MRMKKWTWPKNYIGAKWEGYYVFMRQNRDSDVLTRSNFRSALAALGGETGEDDNGISEVAVVWESHYACGWMEWIAIHESAVEKIATAENILERLEDYPVLDGDDFSLLEAEECAKTWGYMGASGRIEYMRGHAHTCENIRGMFEAIRGGSWDAAASMLHCPSNLIY